DELNHMRDAVAAGNRCRSARGLINRIRALAGHPVEEAPAAAPAAAPASAAAAAPAPQAPQSAAPASFEPEVEYTVDSDFGSQTDVVPTLTEAFASEPAPQAEQASHEAGEPIEEIAAEFGADELGAAAPRESVRVEEPASHTETGTHAALDVAALQPELPPDPAAEAQPEEAPAPALPPGREPQVQERQEF